MVMYGEYNKDGSLKNEADRCILTNKSVNAFNSVRERISNTPFFYRVASSAYHLLTEEHRVDFYVHAGDEDAALAAYYKRYNLEPPSAEAAGGTSLADEALARLTAERKAEAKVAGNPAIAGNEEAELHELTRMPKSKGSSK